MQFAVTTFGQRSHPDFPAEFDVLLDVNNDGAPDLDVFNADIGQLTTGTISGQNGVFVVDLAAGTASGPYFYTIADLDSANAILTVPLGALKTAAGLALTATSPFTYSVLAFDNYFTGNLTDSIGPMGYELDMPQVFPDQPDVLIPAGGAVTINAVPNSAYNGNSPSQIGFLLMYTDGPTGKESDVVKINHP